MSVFNFVFFPCRKNLDNQEKEKVYAPVEFRFLSEKNEKVQQLSVGEKFKLLFFLDDDSGNYSTFTCLENLLIINSVTIPVFAIND